MAAAVIPIATTIPMIHRTILFRIVASIIDLREAIWAVGAPSRVKRITRRRAGCDHVSNVMQFRRSEIIT